MYSECNTSVCSGCGEQYIKTTYHISLRVRHGHFLKNDCEIRICQTGASYTLAAIIKMKHTSHLLYYVR